MSLLEGKIGVSYIVLMLSLDNAVGRRLEAMGLTEGTRIQILNNKKSGSVIFNVRGTRLAVGKKIAQAIEVREDA